MNISYKWLKQYTPVDVPEKVFVREMCMTGTEITGYTKPAEKIKNVVVGKILSIQKHENADKLIVCSVDTGENNPIQIVTGATNVFEGAYVPVALNGAELPNGMHIKKGKLRGVESCGMMCSVGELGISASDYPNAIEDGILILQHETIGKNICDVLGLDDTVFVADIATNRSDCLSMIGIAREAAATFHKSITIPRPTVKGNGDDIYKFLQVEVHAPELCKRYSARVVTDIKIEPSPAWLVERLRANGIRAINNIVDITNYVMLEYGQPMHAFDYDSIHAGKIIVRRANNNETVITLDGKQHICTDDILVIADHEKAVGLAGIMGGENSEIKDSTKTIVFESANFDGATIRKGAKQLGMRTDASALFEKRLDPSQTMVALDRACELIELLNAGKVTSNYIDIDYSDKTKKTIELEPEWINNHLGTQIPVSQMRDILTNIGFQVNENTITVPAFRMDIENKYDISEEIARFYGYDNIPAENFKGIVEPVGLTDKQKFENKVGEYFRACSLHEIITFSFTSPKVYDKLSLPQTSPLRNFLKIQNPLGEDTSIMRTTALPSMLEVLARNYSFRIQKAAMYEIATVYIKNEDTTKLPSEPKIVTAGFYGEIDYYKIKNILESIFSQLNIKNLVFKMPDDDNQTYHPGRTADVYSGNRYLGKFGQIHPTVSKNYGIDVPVYAAEFPLDNLYNCHSIKIEYKPIPKFPAVSRDLALICNIDEYSGNIEAKIKKYAGKELESIKVFDVYQGAQVPTGHKSIAYALTFRNSDKTLTDENADELITKILNGLEKDNIYLRQ